MGVINTILGLGASVIMPIVIFLLGVVFRMKVKNALRAGLTVGIGFTGISLAISLVSDNLGGLVKAMQANWGLALDITDVGWPAASGIAFGSGTFVLASIVTFLIVNVICLAIKITHTLNVDIFNYWHFILIGTVSYFVTGNFILGIVVGTLFMMVNTILGERQEQVITDFAGEQMAGLTFSTQGFPLQLLFARGVDWVIDKIPGLNKISFNLGNLPSSISFFGEPMILGFLLGGIMSFLAGYKWDAALVVAVGLSAAMFLLPRMVSIMMEGLAPLTDAARDFMNTRFPGKKVQHCYGLLYASGRQGRYHYGNHHCADRARTGNHSSGKQISSVYRPYCPSILDDRCCHRHKEKLFQGLDCCGADTLHRPVDCDRPGTADHTDGCRRRI